SDIRQHGSINPVHLGHVPQIDGRELSLGAYPGTGQIRFLRVLKMLNHTRDVSLDLDVRRDGKCHTRSPPRMQSATALSAGEHSPGLRLPRDSSMCRSRTHVQILLACHWV